MSVRHSRMSSWSIPLRQWLTLLAASSRITVMQCSHEPYFLSEPMSLQRCSCSQRALASCSPALRAAGFGAEAGVIGGAVSLSLLQPASAIEKTADAMANDDR